MKKETFDRYATLLRHLLTFFGTYLIGKDLFGTQVNETVINEIIGAVMVIVGFVWTVIEKKVGIESTQGVLRHVLSTFGGLLVASGKLTSESLERITTIITLLVPMILSIVARKKSLKVARGEITPQELKK